MATTFDPAKHFTKVKGQDYLPVKWRLVWLRTEHPLARIETEIVRLGEGAALMKATVTLPPQPVVDGKTGEIVDTDELWVASATAYKTCTRTEFEDYIEKAETGAIGRALANLGYGTQFADADLADPDAAVPAHQESRQHQPQQRQQPQRQQPQRPQRSNYEP